MAGKHRLKKTPNQRRTLGATWAAAVALVAILLMGFTSPATSSTADPSEAIQQAQQAAMQAWKAKVDAIPTLGTVAGASEADSEVTGAVATRRASTENTCR